MEKTNQEGRQVLLYKQLMIFLFGLVVSNFYTMQAHAAVADVTVSDVTTRAFSVVWVSDEEITSATIRVYEDENGDIPVTDGIVVKLVSPPEALSNGIAKVDVTGLAADTIYFIETETIGVGEGAVPVFFPESTSLLIEVKTALSTTRENPTGGPIVNDLIQHEIFEPDGVTESQGTLLMLKIPSISDYPLTAFVGEGFSASRAVVDLNNLFEDASGISAEVLANTVMELSEFRGLLCNVADQKKTILRRAPVHIENPSITELELAAACFSPDGISADFNCDQVIDPLDFFDFQGQFGRTNSSCKFNSDFDFNNDGVIDPLDFFDFQPVFGRVEL